MKENVSSTNKDCLFYLSGSGNRRGSPPNQDGGQIPG